jgi:hypothetical protein
MPTRHRTSLFSLKTHLTMRFALSTAVVAAVYANSALAAPLDEHSAGLMARQSGPSSQFLPSSAALRSSWTLQGCAPDRYPDGRAIMQWYKEVGTIDECLQYCDSVGAAYCGAGECSRQLPSAHALTPLPRRVRLPVLRRQRARDGHQRARLAADDEQRRRLQHAGAQQ